MNYLLPGVDALRKARTLDKPCPWCGEMPELSHRLGHRFAVYCNNDECGVQPQATASSSVEAWAIWNTRK